MTTMFRIACRLASLGAFSVTLGTASESWAQQYNNCPTPQATSKRASCYSAGIRECAAKYNVQTTSFYECDMNLRRTCGTDAGCR
jgi:hypothetical protein